MYPAKLIIFISALFGLMMAMIANQSFDLSRLEGTIVFMFFYAAAALGMTTILAITRVIKVLEKDQEESEHV